MSKPYRLWTNDEKANSVAHARTWRRTPKGVLSSIYHVQRRSSLVRHHPAPSYSLSDLYNRFADDEAYLLLHRQWVNSGFDHYMKPSLDRIDASKPYTLDNIQVVTWRENLVKARLESSRTEVIMLGENGEEVETFASIRAAARSTGISAGNICACCMGIRKTAGGRRWKYGLAKKYRSTRSYAPRPEVISSKTKLKARSLRFWSDHPEMSAPVAAKALEDVKPADLYRWRRTARMWREQRRPCPYV